MRRCRVMGGAATSASPSVGSDFGSNMLWFYTDDAPGLKISPTIVLVITLCFIAFVAALHVFGKIYRAKAGAGL
ncbi:hypothetical protein ERO13_A07G116550v2 [Gossypium hirsutum]|uniref:Protein transport protein Sec61 subunit beta n=3 Tax=Gossypium TaxID=3633 RepID=A0ABR0PBT5_GOSAR|nr:hypothetical protein ERO13_A07G116550v2 [Gossypium hirsutum]KAK5818579.1 hypothetical protein PVK06_023521 [Gossypium arboreum]TYI19034.1 hypothetical protein ES332_A07G136000v1 [Gossypium tomentosum]TYJ26565.1 hypothetical protein E1A91_A07G128600v1 [Gossypium mustelinum]